MTGYTKLRNGCKLVKIFSTKNVVFTNLFLECIICISDDVNLKQGHTNKGTARILRSDNDKTNKRNGSTLRTEESNDPGNNFTKAF